MKLAYFGHHKSGSTWIETLIKQVCYLVNLKCQIASNPQLFDFDLDSYLQNENIDFICYTNANIHFIKPILEKIKGFHVIRDPRDIVVSAYFSHRYSHSTHYWPELNDYRQELEHLPKEKGLLFVIDYLSYMKVNGVELNIFGEMQEWNYNLPNILEIKFEEMIANPYNKFLDLLQFLDLLDDSPYISVKSMSSYLVSETLNRGLKKINPSHKNKMSFNSKIYAWQALNIVYEHDFSRYARGRKPGEEDVKSHNRKGVAGDWKNHFQEEHKQFFKDKYGSLLVQLGYEENNDW
ncbi:sulfotransferase domain-containing protein [Capilliphycus salinus ALCB114379]|uniref:sulfotransferase domain-containing protein n=1 Tax=Capilliphycus salinus TaxID=2768948 RepID=UPI0039A48108